MRSGRVYRLLRLARNRAVLVSKRLAGVHPTAYVHPSSAVEPDLSAEPYVFVGRNCTIGPFVQIGRYSMLASEVAIVGDDHVIDDPHVPMQFAGRPPQRTTTIGADVWIGHRTVILRGIGIGDGAVVGAGSVVTRDVPAREVWAGVPARKLRDRFAAPADAEAHREMLTRPAKVRFAGKQRRLDPLS